MTAATLPRRRDLSHRARLFAGLRVGLTVALIVLVIWLSGLFQAFRLGITDVFFVPHDTSGQIVIVAIDDDSLAAYGRSMVEWPRTIHAELVDRLSQDGARVIAFDVLFDRPAVGDDQLVEAIRRARTESEQRTRVVMPLVGAQRQANPSGSIPQFSYFLLPTSTLNAETAALGHTNALPDADGTVRAQPVRIQSGDETYLSFGLATYLTYLRIPTTAFDQVITIHGDHLTLPSGHTVPLHGQGDMTINYFSQPGDGRFPTYSLQDVIAGQIDPAVFQDKIVLVGPNNQAVSSDEYPVPSGARSAMMSGVEIHANIIETLLQNQPLSTQGRRSQVATFGLLALLAGMIYAYASRRGWWLLLAMIGLILGGAVAAFTVFNVGHQVINLLDPLLALVLPAPAMLIFNTAQEIRRRRQAELLWDSLIAAARERLSLERILPGLARDMQHIVRCSEPEVWLHDPRTKALKRAYPPPAEDGEPPTPAALIPTAISAGTILHQGDDLAVPFAWQGETLGVLFTHPAERISPPARSLLDLFAWQTAAVLANVRLYAETTDLVDLKTRMIRTVSHDLKNPLTIVTMACDMLTDDLPDEGGLDSLQARYIGMIGNAAETMNTLINSILDLERARRGINLAEPYDLPALISEVVLQLDPTIQQKKQTVTLDLPPTVPLLSGDAVQIKQAFSNLIGNAVKYTPDLGRIQVHVAQEDGHVLARVEDSGYGISPDAQKKLFQEFYRVRTEETANIPGTGLGLSLVKTIVEAHGGRVWVDSVEHQGSTFYVELPLPSAGA